MNTLPISAQTALLLTASNAFMTFAWHGHLKSLADKPWLTAARVSWGIALLSTCCRCRATASAVAAA